MTNHQGARWGGTITESPGQVRGTGDTWLLGGRLACLDPISRADDDE